MMQRIDLTMFFLSISSAALMGMGLIPQAENEDPKVDLELAKHNIDLLELMKEKTKGNRSPEEDQLIDKLLFEVRMHFLEVQKKIGK